MLIKYTPGHRTRASKANAPQMPYYTIPLNHKLCCCFLAEILEMCFLLYIYVCTLLHSLKIKNSRYVHLA